MSTKEKNKLPELPKQLDKKEARFGLKMREWLEKHPIQSCQIETKQTPTDVISFSEVGQEQLAFLLSVKGPKGVLVRNNEGIKGTADYNYSRQAGAWIVIKFKSGFHVIDVETFIKEKKESKRKSLTFKRAGEISTWSV